MDEHDMRAHNFRKPVSQVDVLNVKNVTNGEVYFARATLVDVSASGLLLRVERENILSLNLRSTLTLSPIVGASVGFTIEIMDTYIEGVVARTKPEGRGVFVVAVDFREDAPEYWRNCLVDLLPSENDTGVYDADDTEVIESLQDDDSDEEDSDESDNS